MTNNSPLIAIQQDVEESLYEQKDERESDRIEFEHLRQACGIASNGSIEAAALDALKTTNVVIYKRCFSRLTHADMELALLLLLLS